jgi:hypothetical protein
MLLSPALLRILLVTNLLHAPLPLRYGPGGSAKGGRMMGRRGVSKQSPRANNFGMVATSTGVEFVRQAPNYHFHTCAACAAMA